MASEKKIPKLEFTEERITSLVEKLIDDDTLIVTDLYGYPALSQIGRTALVRDCYAESVEEIKTGNQY